LTISGNTPHVFLNILYEYPGGIKFNFVIG